ncbi:hypothetical protein B0H11DRAFT_2069393 [Mycena galericulata]|nr:hypothetical protein B0H11DRAFT_2069393 [Mycena galericulata]
MSRQVQGPIIIVDELSVTVSRPGQVSWWEMDDCNFNLPVPAARPNPGALWARFNRERVEQQIVTGSKCVEEPTTHIPSHLSSISSIGSVNMRSLRSLPGGLGTSTLILANPDRSFWEMKSKHCSDKDISAILPHITFPNLRKISIDARPDPAILSAFLCRHPRIEEIDYFYGSFFSGLQSPSQTLIHPEVKLPALKSISSYRSWSLPALLRGLVLPSTIPISISVYYRRNTRRARALFLSTLEAIHMQPAEQPVRIVLLIFLHDKKFYTPKMTYNSREICAAQNLAAVDYICISTGHVDHARAFLPWLQHVPTLRNLTILMGKPAAQPAIDLLQEEATKELPACTIRIMNL